MTVIDMSGHVLQAVMGVGDEVGTLRWTRCIVELVRAASHMCPTSMGVAYLEMLHKLSRWVPYCGLYCRLCCRLYCVCTVVCIAACTAACTALRDVVWLAAWTCAQGSWLSPPAPLSLV